jgi:hypothetical protein
MVRGERAIEAENEGGVIEIIGEGIEGGKEEGVGEEGGRGKEG